MKADEAPKKKVGIFDRLEQTKTGSTQQQRVEITGVNSVPTTTASIFSRLGGKTDDIDLDDEQAVQFAGILKSAPKKVIENISIASNSKISRFFLFLIFFLNLKFKTRSLALKNRPNHSKKRF